MSKLLYGVGIKDCDSLTEKKIELPKVGGKRKRKTVWFCPFYAVWTNMIQRCHSDKYKAKTKTYKHCTVDETWLVFSVFKAWMKSQPWKGNEIDKDILFNGNKHYSPETCVFISHMTNSFVIDCGSRRGNCSLGVYNNKDRGKFDSFCSNPIIKKREFLGSYLTDNEAHIAWRKRKNEIAHQLAELQHDDRVADALRLRYKS